MVDLVVVGLGNMKEKSNIDLVHELRNEFKAIGLPFTIKVVRQVTKPMSASFIINATPDTIAVLEISSRCSRRDRPYLTGFTTTSGLVVRDFNLDGLSDCFLDREDQIDFYNAIETFEDRDLVFTIELALEETHVLDFIESFREKTKPMRERVFSEEFDEEVDGHLLEDEYKDSNGYK